MKLEIKFEKDSANLEKILKQAIESMENPLQAESLYLDISKNLEKDYYEDAQFSEMYTELKLLYDTSQQLYNYFFDYYVQRVKTEKSSKLEIRNDYSQFNTETLSNIIKLAFKFVFSLRGYLLSSIEDGELTFVVGGSTPEGELVEKTYDLKEDVFNNLRISLNTMTIHLSSELEKAENLEKVSYGGVLSQWKNILTWSDVSKAYTTGEEPVFIENEGRKWYAKDSKDILVCIAFQGEKNFLKGYLLSEKNPVQYNDGWLYQWAKILYSQNKDFLLNENSDFPLYPLFSKGGGIENLAGIRGGDNGLEQYKYGNTQIITINNIISTLNNIIFNISKILDYIDSRARGLKGRNIKINDRLEELAKSFTADDENAKRVKKMIVSQLLK